MFSDTFAGITPTSVPGFVAAQIIGGLLALAAVAWWFPRPHQPITGGDS
jgi:glycerol uptake facilitator-like aquaporin